jgi:hypothetical protein
MMEVEKNVVTGGRKQPDSTSEEKERRTAKLEEVDTSLAFDWLLLR